MKKPLTAYAWGVKHGSCPDALAWRKSLGLKATQATAWRKCKRGDWLIWQFERLPLAIQRKHFASLMHGIEMSVGRAVKKFALTGSSTREWSEKWLSGEDRTAARAAEAARAADAAWAARAADAAWAARTARATWAAKAAWATWAAEAAWAAMAAMEARAAMAARAAWAAEAAMAAESARQARDIRCGIPEWPGEV